MKTKIFLSVLSSLLIFLSSCVKDDVYVNDTTPVSDIKLVINEVASNNGDPNPDWMEIYNPGDAEVDISGFGVYDKPAAIYTIPAGTKIAAKGYFVIVCDVALAGSDAVHYAAFGISSGGESVFLVDATTAIIDQVDVPAMPLGISYARIPDGGDVFSNANTTQGEPNSNTDEPPLLIANSITVVDDNSGFEYTVTASDAGGIRDVKIYTEAGTDIKITEMAPIGGGLYTYKFPVIEAGTTVKYYVVATDETGKKTYFPSTAPETNASFVVANGSPVFESVVLSNENPSDGEAVNFTVKAYDKTGIMEVRLYYTLNDALSATKVIVILTTTDHLTFTGTIPGQPDLTKISYYLRAEDNSALRTYFPTETVVDDVVTSAFNHDVASTWPFINVAPLVPLNQLVINEIQASGSPWDFVELYNSTNATIDISGFRIYDSGGLGVAYTIPAGTSIAAGGFYLMETGSGSPQGQWGISSSAEDITLINTSDVIVDQLLKINWPGVPLVARKKDGLPKWIVPSAESKGTANP
ncbi:MAG: lamin tail domain-containing protein [Bacteroidales bacterium]|nr:lamin tail domain-containing protein [Bacteroidales bacterium]